MGERGLTGDRFELRSYGSIFLLFLFDNVEEKRGKRATKDSRGKWVSLVIKAIKVILDHKGMYIEYVIDFDQFCHNYIHVDHKV